MLHFILEQQLFMKNTDAPTIATGQSSDSNANTNSKKKNPFTSPLLTISAVRKLYKVRIINVHTAIAMYIASVNTTSIPLFITSKIIFYIFVEWDSYLTLMLPPIL